MFPDSVSFILFELRKLLEAFGLTVPNRGTRIIQYASESRLCRENPTYNI